MNRIVWHDKKFTAEVQEVADEVAEEGADMVLNDAQQILMRDAKHPTGKLASEIEVKKSKFKDGGFIVIAQGPGNYDKFYATFVELGTHKMDAIPYLRPALHKNERKIQRMFKDRLK